jgi:Histidine kinase
MSIPALPYPPNLTWHRVIPRLLILNQVLALIGALSQYVAELLSNQTAQPLGLAYYYVQLQCVSVFGLGLSISSALLIARRAWRRTPDMAERYAKRGLFLGLPVAAKWQVAGVLALLLPVSSWASLALFRLLQTGPLSPWLPQVIPPFKMMVFDITYGGTVILVFEYFHDRALLSEAREKLAQKLSAQAQLDLLRAQLDPHMLFNTLSNLYELIDESPAQARTMLSHLIDYLRATLAGSRITEHPLSDEFALAADYLALMQVRMGDRLQTRLNLPPHLARAQVPAMLLQPLVENAIKHGLELRKAEGRLQVSAFQEGLHLVLQVTNSGTAYDPSADGRSTGGFGLSYVRDRLHALYGDEAQLALQPQPAQDMTQVTVTLPLHLTQTPPPP